MLRGISHVGFAFQSNSLIWMSAIQFISILDNIKTKQAYCLVLGFKFPEHPLRTNHS